MTFLSTCDNSFFQCDPLHTTHCALQRNSGQGVLCKILQFNSAKTQKLEARRRLRDEWFASDLPWAPEEPGKVRLFPVPQERERPWGKKLPYQAQVRAADSVRTKISALEARPQPQKYAAHILLTLLSLPLPGKLESRCF